MAVKYIIGWMKAHGFKKILNAEKLHELIERYSAIKLFTSKNAMKDEETQCAKKRKMEFWKDNKCTKTLNFGVCSDDVCIECGEGEILRGDNAGTCGFCGEVCHYECS